MKIVYLISCVSGDNTGQGGHYYSARSISKAIQTAGHDTTLMVLGDFFPKSYEDIKSDVKYIEFTGRNYYSFFRKVYSVLKAISPDSVHVFDNKSFFVARSISLFQRFGLVLTKPGGPNPTRFFPYCKDMITFSLENKDYFESGRKFEKSNIHFIPNRIENFSTDWDAIGEIKSDLPEGIRVITRIGRIGKAYQGVIAQTGNLVRFLNSKGMNFIGVVVGVVESEEIFNDLAEEFSNELLFYTTPEYTKNASRLLEVGEACVGTGRSLMEAAFKGRILLTTLNGSDYPVLVNKDNFMELMRTNFSPRNTLITNNAERQLESIKTIFSNSENCKEMKDFSVEASKQYFELDSVVEKYSDIYANSLKEHKLFDLILNFATFIFYFRPRFFRNIK